MTESELSKIQEWRSSVKRFDPSKKIKQETWDTLERSLILSPSSYGLQPWKFFVVTNLDVKNRLKPHSWGQSQVTDCSHFVIFTYRNNMTLEYVQTYVDLIKEVRRLPDAKVEGYKQMMISDVVNGPRNSIVKEWAARQVYIALGNFMTSAAALGVDTCPMEGIDPAKYDEILGLVDSDYSTVVACAAGYRHLEDSYSKLAKVRFPASKLIVQM